MSGEQFATFCAEHPDLFFEMSAEGERIVLPPAAFGTGAPRSPDASYVLKSRLEALSASQRVSFLPLCPDFVVEIKSKTDRRKTLHANRSEYLSQGAQLGWLIDPAAQSISIYRPNAEPELLSNPQTHTAEAPSTTSCLI